MELNLANVAVVVLSEGNNPRLLNPDFLDVLVTPPFAHVMYENSVQFLVEIGKLTVQINQPHVVDWESVLPEMATAYLELLPHVPYRAVGINFVFFGDTPPERPFTRLLKEGPWLQAEGGLSRATIELHYLERLPQLNVKIAVEESAHPGGGKVDRLVFRVNYHRDFAQDETQARAEHIRSIGFLKSRFIEFAAFLPFD
jgi:hypothetical protein